MLISVIIPVYNSGNTIKACIDSVLNQTYTGAIEIIIINDGSKDNSRKIIEQIVENNSGPIAIQLINKINAGVSSARNMAMKLAKGELIAFLDSDDEWLPDKLKRQVEVLNRNPHIDFLGTNRNDEYFNRVLWKKLDHLTKISSRLLLVKFLFVVPTVIFKTKIIKTIGYFDESQKYAEEGNYFIRIAQKFNCYLLNESLVLTGGGKAHFGHSGLSGNLNAMELGELKNIKDALKLKIINIFQYIFLVLFSSMKYIRRLLIVKYRG